MPRISTTKLVVGWTGFLLIVPVILLGAICRLIVDAFYIGYHDLGDFIEHWLARSESARKP